MGEAHSARYSIHPGSTKMYHDLRCLYWWDGMKKDIAEFVAQCPNLSTSQNRTSKAWWIITGHRDPDLEMGDY